MNGAESLVRTLVGGGIEVCFSNPGTSEMHFVAALDRVEGMQCVLGLFEGVATGAADGYARMAGKPAATLLHLGPGLGNGLANLHNAQRASTPIINIVGDHATFHRKHDAPLTSDIESVAQSVSGWVRTSVDAYRLAGDAAAAVAAVQTPPGQIATLILPADVAWNEAAGVVALPPPVKPAPVSGAAVANAARVLRSGEPALLLVGGCALREEPLALAGRIAEVSGAKLMAETFNARIERGAGRVAAERIPYPIDQALGALNGVRHLILIGAKPPVAFFAYPGKPSRLSPDDAEIHVLAERGQDVAQALEGLADEMGARCKAAAFAPLAIPAPAGGPITPVSLGLSIAALLPENAIVVDEAITTGRSFYAASRCSRPHDWLQNMGGSIGFGMPQAAGAAVACPGRRVVSLEGDGSAMYTVQALWTQAREGLDVTTLLFSNRSYAILQHELANIGAQPAGRKTLDMLDIGRPDLDWAAISRGMGVPASRAETMEAFNTQFADALKTPGPSLIEVML